ncbi:SGNH/GDSL hydrolase family protein [Rhodomicrobium sp. Az07]|uniref:SGNH/GDSL hydrolase family protein n=1 Tax=Rhodomicrobium sp. Az07 TaxID=2839034 RepID=UPI001BEB00B2|nr:SGNH/GDSL hydrolase family protein [Rhodomicrobium sp. Az07]MBT3070837.1 SGNH/GDSL hydrolase family protein [Rhodomicrobium sp. Az07]
MPDRDEAAGGFGYISAPNQDVRRFFARNKINRFSMRSDEIEAQKAPDHTRILFIGDSVTYGTTYIDQTRIFTTLVANRASERIGNPVEILNASAGGWAPENEVGFLLSKGTFESDLVLIVLNTADLNSPLADSSRMPGCPPKNLQLRLAKSTRGIWLPGFLESVAWQQTPELSLGRQVTSSTKLQ